MIEGIPDGWELVRIGKVKPGECWLDPDGIVIHWYQSLESEGRNYVIIKRIEKPKQYRHFANGAEFAPHRDRWLMHPRDSDKRFKPGDYNDKGVWGLDRRHYDYEHLFESGTLFDDGSPFGVEVTS